ncbi:MAG: glycosyltransferase family 2 protein [Oscillochloridaceae bacterium umkhey_bin13]
METVTGLAAAIIARDEEQHLDGCLASLVGLADEVLVLLDDRTRDASAAIATARGARVVTAAWQGYPAQHNLALRLCRQPWVLFVDADERVTPELASAIRALLATTPSADGYWLPRYNLFFGQTLRGGGWYPDHQLRLLRREVAHYDEARLVHEYAEVPGPTAYLHAHLLHHNIDRLGELWAKQSGYALAEARTLYRAGRRARARNLFGAPAREFWRRYISLGGWRDGGLGLFLSATMAWHEVVKFVFLFGLEAGGSHPAHK